MLIWATIELRGCSFPAKDETVAHKLYYLILMTFFPVFSFPVATGTYVVK